MAWPRVLAGDQDDPGHKPSPLIGANGTFLVDEAALRCRTGTAETMTAQFYHLATVTTLPNATIQVVLTFAHAALTGVHHHRDG